MTNAYIYCANLKNELPLIRLNKMKKIFLFLLLQSVYLLNAQVCFNSADTFAVGSSINPMPHAVISADFNNDGKLDLATANTNDTNISILLGVGGGNFGSSLTFGAGSKPMSLATADFNGDGKPDLAVANSGGGYDSTVSILYGDGTGNFGPPTNYTVGKQPYSIISADFNGDSKPDLAVAVRQSQGISILLGNGGSGFGSIITYTFGFAGNPFSICTADFNNDGHLDLATSSDGLNEVHVYLGDGTGHIGSGTPFSVGSSPYTIIAGDFNNDGNKDLITANNNYNSNNVSILIGNGLGNFASAVNLTIPNNLPTSITSADFDGDAIADLAVANFTNNASILKGTGTGTFILTNTLSIGYHAFSIISADFNNDGKPDLATANTDVNNPTKNVSVSLNCSPTPTCVASVTDSIFKDATPLTWDIIPNYSSQVTSAIWYWGDGTSSNGLYPSHTYTTAGWYSICVTVYTSCGDSATSCRSDSLFRTMNNNGVGNSMVYANVIGNTTNVKHQVQDNIQTFIYPNPTSGQFIIEANINEKHTVDIFDINGQHVFNKVMDGKININLSNLNEGVYTVTIKTFDSIVNKKLVIVH